MTESMQEQEGRSGSAARLREERGQTLVEYALIIAVVSLGSLAALGFLSGKIQELFSKAGSSIENVTVAAGSGGGGGGTPPANGDTVTGSGIPTGGGGSQWYGPGGTNDGPAGLVGLQGIYTDSTPSQATCTLSLPNGFTYTGTWIRQADNIDGWDAPGVSGDYDFACLVNPPFTPPSNDGDMEGITLSGNDTGGEWFNAGAGTGVNNPSPSPSPAGVWDDDTHSGTWFFYPDGGSGSGVWICTWTETTPTSNSYYDFPGSGNNYDSFCN